MWAWLLPVTAWPPRALHAVSSPPTILHRVLPFRPQRVQTLAPHPGAFPLSPSHDLFCSVSLSHSLSRALSLFLSLSLSRAENPHFISAASHFVETAEGITLEGEGEGERETLSISLALTVLVRRLFREERIARAVSISIALIGAE